MSSAKSLTETLPVNKTTIEKDQVKLKDIIYGERNF